METIWNRLDSALGIDAVGGWLSRAIPDLIVASITFAIFFVVHRIAAAVVGRILSTANVDLTARTFVLTITRVAILAIGIVAALGQLGIDTGALLASLGVAGLTIGFAAKDALSNVISGLFIFWDRPFVIGDLVELDGNYGRVEQITMRSTRVVTVDGKMLAIPNTIAANQTVVSYTNFPNLRVDVGATVNPNESLDAIRKLLLNLVEEDPERERSLEPQVVVTALNDFNTEIEVRVWITDERQHLAYRLALRERVFEALTGAGVDMPYETFRLIQAAPPTGQAVA